MPSIPRNDGQAAPNAIPRTGGRLDGSQQQTHIRGPGGHENVRLISGARVASSPATAANMFQANLVASEQFFAQRQADRANTAQEATVRYWVETRNAGSTREPAFTFNVAFLEEPHLTHGFAVATNHNQRDRFHDPRGGATLLSWVRNDRGHYIGVRMAYWASAPRIREDYYTLERVTYKTVNGADIKEPPFTAVHHLSFTGLAYKALPGAARTRISTVRPHEVSYGSGGKATPQLTKARVDAEVKKLRAAIDEFWADKGYGPDIRPAVFSTYVANLEQQIENLLYQYKHYYSQNDLHFLRYGTDQITQR